MDVYILEVLFGILIESPTLFFFSLPPSQVFYLFCAALYYFTMNQKDTVVDHIDVADSSRSSDLGEKGVAKNAYPLNDEDYVVTFKTWIVVAIMASAYGVSMINPRILCFELTVLQVSFWIVPTIAVISTQVATRLGDPSAGIWFTSLYTATNTIAFMICGANSDLFGRRWFLIMGNVLLLVGHLMCGLAQNATTMIAGFAIIGFGAGNAQLAAFALPELLPNKWRHSKLQFLKNIMIE